MDTDLADQGSTNAEPPLAQYARKLRIELEAVETEMERLLFAAAGPGSAALSPASGDPESRPPGPGS